MFLPELAAFVMFVSLIGAASRASAQNADAKAAARAAFEKGVAAFDDRRFAEAAEAFDTAYRLSPAYVVLYNIGQVDVILGRSVEAVDAFDRYLKQGASAVPADRRREVEGEIEKQTARIGTIAVRTFPDGAQLRVDGALVGTTPLPKPVRVTAGRHTVAATLKGRAPEIREVDVGGRAEIALELTLEPTASDGTASAPSVAPPAAPPAAAPAPPSAAGDAKPPEDTAAGESVPAPPQIVSQQVTVPGYYVRETTVGFHYPDRWTIEQVGPNTYRWRPLPAQFVPK